MKRILKAVARKIKDIFTGWEMGTVHQAWKH